MNTPPHQPNPNTPWQPPFPPIRLGPTKEYREKYVFAKWKRLVEGILWENEILPSIMQTETKK